MSEGLPEILFEAIDKLGILVAIILLILLQSEKKEKEKIENHKQLEKEKLEKNVEKLENINRSLASDLETLNRRNIGNNERLRSQIQSISTLHNKNRQTKLSEIIKFGQQENIDPSFPPNEIKKLLNDESVGVRRYSLKILARIGNKQSFDLVINEGLRDPHPANQVYSLYLLGKYLVKKDLHEMYVEKLKSYLENENNLVRQEAFWALTKLNKNIDVSNVCKIPNSTYECLAFILIRGIEENQKILMDFENFNRFSKFGILEFGIAYGRYDVIVKVLCDNVNDLNQVVLRDLQDLKWVLSTRTLIVINDYCISYWLKDREITDKTSISYVMFKTPATDTRGLVTCLWDYSFKTGKVVEAAGVYGDSDVIARIEANNEEDRDSLICKIVRELPLIESIETYTIQTGSFNPNDERASSSLYRKFDKENLPEKYEPLENETIYKYTHPSSI